MQANQDFKIKLIFPPLFEGDLKFSTSVDLYHLPYGISILTAFLRENNYYVEQQDLCIRFNRRKSHLFPLLKPKIDMSFSQYKDEIRRFLKSDEKGGKLGLLVDKVLDSTSIEGFNAIGFSMISIYHFLFALLLSKKIKQITTTPIIFGGPFITLYGHLYPEVFNFIDYMIVGDGRVPLLKLIDYFNKKIPISEVPNLIYRENGKLITNPKEDYPIEDIPIADFSDLPLELYENRYSIFSGHGIIFPYQITRGCANRCSFCSHNYIDDKLKFKSYEKVLSELNQMKERYNSKTFFFIDFQINNSYEYLEGLCDLFIKRRLNINWNACAKVGNLDKHILKKMKEAGCRLLCFGIESGSDRVLKMMNKGFTAEQASQTLQVTYEVGITIYISLLIGYPNETLQDINQTIEFIKKNRRYIYHCSMHKLELYYGTPIYLNHHNYGISNLIPTRLPYIFGFDELNGLKWEQKQRQQVDNYNKVLKVYKNTILFKTYRTDFLSSILYLLRSLFLRKKT